MDTAPLQSYVKSILLREDHIYLVISDLKYKQLAQMPQALNSLHRSRCHMKRGYLPSQSSNKEMSVQSFRALNLISKHQLSWTAKKFCSIMTIPVPDNPVKRAEMSHKARSSVSRGILFSICITCRLTETPTYCTSPSNMNGRGLLTTTTLLLSHCAVKARPLLTSTQHC